MSRPISARSLLAVLALCAASCGGGGGGGGLAGGGTVPPGALDLQLLTGSLNTPTFLTSPSGDPRLFVTEKGGVVTILENDQVLPVPFLDLASQVSNGGEQGLLGLAFAPNYAASRRFYVSYTDLAGELVIARYLRSTTDPYRADPASGVTVIVVPQDDEVHNGGMIAFGPDGFLYIGTGDGNGLTGPDPLGNAQNLGVLSGKLLRIDVSGASYTVPASNPYVGVAGARGEIWSSGLRNPWRFSFDRATGDLFIADVGAADAEEINVARNNAGGGRGLNYGWNIMEGTDCFLPPTNCDTTCLTLPNYEFDHASGACSVTGGYVYRGSAIPALRGRYFFADFCAGWVRSFVVTNGQLGPLETWTNLVSIGTITSLGEDAAGELYVLTGQGDVFRLVAP